jgi:valyl-tRNA synthetase
MKTIADPALKAVMEDDVQFFPENQKNVYRHWMENIRDWCISRQLWWGHRIPAYYYDDDVFVAASSEDALNQVKDKTGNNDLTLDDLRQDEDVLDTWFSSWLWPMSVFDGFSSREEIEYYYPSNVLVTGWDIIFLWVARMIMAGYEWEGKRPFKDVYFTGMVRDKQRRKMSKQLGNSPDALKLISDFGADGVRFGMLSCSPAGGDLLFDEKLVEQGRNFSNKLWNALRLVKSFEVETAPLSDLDKLSINWINSRINQVASQLNSDFEQYKLSEAVMKLYHLVWGDFCSWYLEMIKPEYQAKIGNEVLKETVKIFTKLSTMLHPFMPFITEEIYHQLNEVSSEDSCMNTSYPKGGDYNSNLIAELKMAQDIIANVRDVRNKNNLKAKELLELSIIKSDKADQFINSPGLRELCIKLAFLESFDIVDKKADAAVSFIVGTENLFVALEQNIDVEAELESLNKDLVYQQGFVKGIQGKLNNERFVSGAPAVVVDKERQKLHDGLDRIKMIEQSIERLK